VRDHVVGLASRLVAIDSANPSLVPGGAGEGEIAAFIAGWAHANGLEAELRDALPGRPSVVVRARGTGGGRTLLLCGHIDTVGFAGMVGPLTPRVEGDRLYGRGAYDMKAGVAAALVACLEVARLGLAGDVVVAAVADEEYASLGVQDVLGSLRADAAVVTEPTGLELVIAHKGFIWAELAVSGRAAHGSRPDLGIDAILRFGPILVGLAELDASLGERRHPLLGRGSVHASMIEGGGELSSYPARCVLRLERRTLPGERAADVESELDSLLERCRAVDPSLVAERQTLMVRGPFEVAADAEIVEAVRAAAALGGARPRLGGASFWADSGFIADAGIPTVLFGPGGAGAHAQEEWVSIGDTVAVARALVATALRLCA
jgi:acetylornithine deacetylase